MAATNKRGVFSLETVLERQDSNNWSKIPEVFRYVNSLATTGGPAYGYWAGGTSVSTVTRLDFGNDTAAQATKGSLINPVYSYGGTASASYAYFYGGQGPGGGSRISRIDFADDTSTATPKGPLSAAAGYQGAVGNDSYGYSVAGGGSVPTTSNVDRLDYANDTSTASPKGKASEARQGVLGGAGNNSYGYIGGGVVHPGTHTKTTIDRIDYANDTATMAVKGPLNAARYYMGAAGNSSYGYFGCGNNGPSKTDRLDYSSDTTQTSQKAALTQAKGFYGSTGSNAYGYYGGGGPAGPGSRVDRIDYSNDTAVATSMSNLPQSLMKLTAAAAQDNGQPAPQSIVPAFRIEPGMTPVPNFGYVVGGTTPTQVSIVDRIDYANDTATAAVKGSLDKNYSAHQSTSNPTHAYAASGYPSNTSVSRIEFSNDTATAVAKGPLTAHHNYFGATGNASFGYYAGGEPSVQSTVDRIDYSNDTATALVKGPLSLAKKNSQACGNISFGYWAGSGYPNRSSVDRIDYSSDTSTASPKGPLENSRGTMAASGTSEFGYWSGGYPYYTKASRIDYSNDTATAVAKAPYPSAVTPYGFSNAAATGSNTHGYAVGGNSYKSSIWRIDYSNDTANAVEKGPLSTGRLRLSAGSPLENGFPSKTPGPVDKGAAGYSISTPTSAANHGYWAGGYDYDEPSGPTGDLTLIQRIDFTNDTATALLKGNLSSSPGVHKSTSSNGSYGYIVGGNIVPSVTRVERVDYSNDTATASVRGPITDPARGAMAGAGNNDYGWHTGGIFAIPSRTVYSKVDRIDYSNDSSTASPKGSLIAARGYHNATGTLNYGYIAAGTPDGQFGPNSSTVQRIDYGNDTATASTKGPLSRGTSQHASTGNANYGWFIGGYGPNSRSKIDRVDYSNDTATASVRGPLYQPSYRLDGTGNANYGYVHPGLYPGNPAGSDGSTEIARIDYSNDTITTAINGHFARSMRIQESAFSAAENGRNPVSLSYTPRIRWVDSASPAPASVAGPAFGYINGANWPTQYSTVERIDFSNDTATAAVKGPLSTDQHRAAGTSSNSTHGYISGNSPAANSIIDRIDFGNDTATSSPKGDLGITACFSSGTGNNDFGYHEGNSCSSRTEIRRIDYSNDTASASQKGNFTLARYGRAASGNQSFGYFTSTNYSSIDRIDYGNDTATAATKGPLSANSNYGRQAIGSPSHVYFAGGAPSTVDRVDYANDGVTALVRGPLSTSSFNKGGAVGDGSYGYFAGGARPSNSTIVDRIDYSNDTATASPKGPLTSALGYARGMGARECALPQTNTAAIAAPVQRPFPFPEQLPLPPSPYLFDAESASSITGTIGGYSRTGTYCNPPSDLASGITYGNQDSTPFDTSTDRNSEIVRCYSFTKYSNRTFAAAITALCERPPQGGTYPISNNWESAWWIGNSGDDDEDILIVVFDDVKTFSGIEISSPSSQYGSSTDRVYAVRLAGSASNFTVDAIGDVAYDGSTTATISASFEAQAIAIYRNGATSWARIGNIRFLK